MTPTDIESDNQGLVIEVPETNPRLVIPVDELAFAYSRSGGPGGQHVNKTETRVELQFDVANSPSLNEQQRARLLARLRNRIDKEGILHVVAATTRSQASNRAAAVERFKLLLQHALHEERPRIVTRPSATAVRHRLEQKRQRGVVKRRRRRIERDEE